MFKDKVFYFFERIAAAILLVLLSPLFLLLCWQVASKLGKPIFFTQLRPGLHGKAFNMIKFRSMRDDKDAQGNLLSDAERLGSFGRALRASSADELPELWNIVKGEMSFVGPRPLLMEYLPLYSPEQAKRHDVKPGITGWAQINGRNALSWQEKFELDVWYVNNRSLILDIKILILTVKKVFVKDGVSAEGEATMSKFTGNSES
ncbi:sugar transferase [Agarivorans sp. B2Z047]|uniref:Lipid carrier: UDP-N-acetylgalactosaminyltransferase n=1 Tax=Agarivorans albus MKT 106 TaxID=1331007 RepID=R9PMX6_AGAAL|nr:MULTISPECIES: sugar transferase [Agarivorans]MPW28711.1 sugar transferase [Agarivorans sp. B2Z047]UQN41272.1 sugar transferase [Agarivorans sp. B2Z047]GAD02732.1 lipid carrier : UDP-N-acetylgalactosaminyltransferase [Agarivorans albus MKT 106]